MRVVDSDSDSDDNVPLAKLRAAASVKTEASVKREPAAASNGTPAAAVPLKRELNADSDSDDNVPISSLAQRQKRVKVEPIVTSQPRSSATPSRPSPRTPQAKKKKRMKIKFKQQECTEELYGTLKGRLVQELLCRWWYVIQWPPADMQPPSLHGLQELDGFRGTYIRVKGDDMGSIVETRPQLGKPSFIHFFAMPSADIQKLLVKAYEKQMEVLKEHEGPDAPMLKELKSALASASKISPDKADRSVAKLMKKYKELATQIEEIQEKMMQDDNTGTEEEEEDAGADDDDDDDDDDVGMEMADDDSAENTNGDDDDDDE